jgi:sugar phosphate isomerase/epimerase
MITRRTLLTTLAAALPLPAQRAAQQPLQRIPKPKFGLQTYSLRYDLEKDFPGTLKLIRQMGFEDLEVSNWPGHTATQYRRLLDDNGLKAVSMMEECRHGAEFLNARGESLAGAKLSCCYHIHGTEFHPSPDGTMFDTLAKRTDAKFANFEMDIYWVVYGGQDPVKLLHRYPGRFPITHIKDIKPGTVLGGLPRDVREDESVVLGTGLVDIEAAIRAAQETGVKQHFIEDEAVDASVQIPKSLKFLYAIRW